MWTCAGVLALAACALAITRDQFYPHGPPLDQKLPRGREVPPPELFLKVPVIFYGETYDSVFVNNFGVLTFRADIPSFINTEFPLPYPAIAAFYTNVDTSEEGAVYFRETDEPHVLSKAEESVQNNFHDYYDFKPTSVFIATWVDVPYTSPIRDRKNSFQVAIISNGTESFVELLYPERDIQWIQRETEPSALPDAKAQAGFIAEDGRMFTLRGSGSHQIRNIVSWSNTHEPGKYVFRVGVISYDENIADPDQYDQTEAEVEEESKTCALSGPSVCHVNARCVDYPAGICCQCNEGFYGNGKSCIKNDVPLRVHGKLNGIINDIHVNDADIQAYVVVADGRAYTALSLAPPTLGGSLQLLNVLGSVVGWLFAQPLGNAKNGYQLTGSLFNHSADVWFPASNDRVVIQQEYYGHDVFDQITTDTDIRGSLPVVLNDAKLEVAEYEEQYTIVESGLIRSDSSRVFTNKITGEKYEARISQTFTFHSCRYAPVTPESSLPLTLKVSKNYLGYEMKENIVRYGTSNKIVPLGQEDPCIRGRDTCGPHSSCVVQGDSFACLCGTGYTNIYQDDVLVCVDIDECAAGTNNCDPNAECINHDGGFQCRCKEGFNGNGIMCTKRSGCQDRKCDVNAQCSESPDGPICICNPGYTGDGTWCYQTSEYVCAHCSQFASCPFLPAAKSYTCQCNRGYSGDGYQCVEDVAAPLFSHTPPPFSSLQSPEPYPSYPSASYPPASNPPTSYPSESYPLPSNPHTSYLPVSDPPPSNPLGSNPPATYSPYPYPPISYRPVSDAPAQTYPDSSYYYYESTTAATKEAEYNETFVLPTCNVQGCFCPQGYLNYRDERNNDLCRLESYIVPTDEPTPPIDDDRTYGCESDADCPPNAVCSFGEDVNGGYVGSCTCPEGYEGDAYECIERTGPSCSCGLNAHCVDTATGEFLCVCDSGYQGDGYNCRPNFSCTNNSDCEFNAECRPNAASGEYICQCIEGYIKDQNDACIPDGQLCNGALCAEHASCLYDEAINIHFCHCDSGYDGDGLTQCVAAGRTCDIRNDCHIDALCSFVENSYQCICKDGFTGDGYSCVLERSCRTDPFLCSPHASCLKRGGGFVCECNSGFSGDGASCEANPKLSGNFLVVSEGATIYRVPFQITSRDYPTPFNSAIDQIAVGIDVDCVAGNIYWGDVVGNTIKRAAYDGSRSENFIKNGVKSPEGVSVDWTSRNIFWTDSKKLTIEVANMDTKVRKVLFAIDGISNPRGIAVHPQRGKIFWSDWKRSGPKIEWANMDGSERGVFLDSGDVTLPNSLAIDWERDRLCYADAGLQAVKCVSIDSLERETVAASCPHPFSLAIKGDTFYWTDWRTLKIEYARTSGDRRGQLPMAVTGRHYGLAVAPAQCPEGGAVCARGGGCAPGQLCLPDGRGGRTCVDGDSSYNEI